MPESAVRGRWTRARVLGGVVITSVMLATGTAGVAAAVPPPPPNPNDSQLHHSKERAQDKAAAVGKLTSELAAAKDKLRSVSARVEAKKELANKARVDFQEAKDAAGKAADQADSAKAQVDSAQARIDSAREDLDAFAAGSYEQGSKVGSLAAFIGSKSPENVLERAQLLDAVSGSKLEALDSMRRARTAKANKDSQARAALADAKQKREAADAAHDKANTAEQTAIDAQRSQQAQTDTLSGKASDLQSQLAAARTKAGNLQSQRARYNDWQDRKRAAEAAAARRAQKAAHATGGGGGGGSNGGGGGGGAAAPPPAQTGSVSAVIARARSELGMPYAWGGGNASGPTRGIHDGGVADSYGDYNKIGFDCSGLMMYAFAAAGVHLRHYTGYQYNSGQHVPLSAKQPGDMLFWHTGSNIHHVALYIGNGMMIEAPQSGSVVQISPVRYGGIMPYATRVL